MAILGALGNLVVSLSADTASFQSDLGRAQRIGEKFGREISRVLGNVAGALAAIGGSAGFTALVKGQIDAADAAGKMSQKVGVASEELSGYMVAARLADVSNEQLQTGFVQLAKNQADFVAGTGESAAAFEALGISQAQVKALNGDNAKLFELVTGKLAQYEDGANKTALATKLLGKSGAELIPLINSLEETKNLAKELGLVYDKETTAAAERFNDNLTTVGLSVQALGLGIAKGVLPTLDALSERMVKTAKDADGVGQAARIADTGLKLLVSGATIVTAVFKSVGEWIGGVAAALVQVGKGEYAQAWETVKNISVDQAENVRGAVTSILETWESTAAKVEARAPSLGKRLAAPGLVSERETREALARQKKALDEYIRQMEVRAKAQEELDAGVAEANRERDKEKLQRFEAAEAIRRQIDPYKEMREELQRITDLMDAGPERGGLTQEEGAAALARVRQGWEDAAREAMHYNQIAEKGKTIAEELGLTFESAFENAIVAGKGFGDVLKSLLQDALRLAARKNITDPLAKAGSSLFGDLFGGLGGLFGGSGGDAAIVNAGIPFGIPLASGMPRVPFDGMPATLHKDEAVLTAAQADAWRSGASGSVVITQHINVDSRADRASIDLAMRRAKDEAVAEVRAIQNASGNARI